jgi:eukaryotic-like serine/threonine-protein kinase
MPDSNPGLMTLFTEALERSDPAERAAYLDRVCRGDVDLRRRVEELLAAHPGIGRFLEPAPPDATGAFVPGDSGTVDLPGGDSATGSSGPEAHPPAAMETADLGTDEVTGTFRSTPTSRERSTTIELGTVIAGRYVLVELIGEGGMGSVYLASQTAPVKRQVALKLIKAGMDSKAVLARFDAERQALALMDHPNIARVYDGGTTERGQPFFVMELAKGVPLTEYCDTHRQSVDARLQLFVSVCQAVQHAHQKGIIHRDLKPGNVLVMEVDGRPTPKVIDFGVAKATEQKLTDLSFSDVGAIVGTPAYMSPEQADPTSMDIDTRTDVYSLGVILYELLTGSTPIDSKHFKRGAILEMLRMVREGDPPRPSTKLSTAEALPNIAANRCIEPARLAKLLQGELDWVVMKAIEKERTRRYDTALGLARDVQRYLADEVVEARPPSRDYRLRKLVRRNKGLVIAASLVFVVLLLGIAGTTAGLIEANHQAGNARNAAMEEGKARIAEAERADGERIAKHQAMSEKKRAEQAEDDALADYRASTDDAIEQLIGSKSAIGPKEKAYLEKMLKRWQAFASRVGDDERSRFIRASAHQSVASLWQRLGQKVQARGEYELALDIFQKLADKFPTKIGYTRNLSSIHNNLAMLLLELGEQKEAREEFKKAINMSRALADQFPNDPSYRQYLAFAHNNLARLYATLGERSEAYQEYMSARNLLVQLAEISATKNAYAHELSVTRNNLALLLVEMGRRDEAQTEYEKARDLQFQQVLQFPNIPDYQIDLADTHNNLGGLFFDLGRQKEALAEFEKSLDLKVKLARQFPANPQYQQRLASTHSNLGTLLDRMGKTDEAKKHHEITIDLLSKLVEQYPSVPMYQMQYAISLSNYGMLVRDSGRVEESLHLFDKAIPKLVAVYEREPRDVTAKLFLSKCYFNRAVALDLLGKHAEALRDWDKAIEFCSVENRPSLRAGRATSRVQAGQVAEGVAEVAELTKSPFWPAAQWYDFACVYAVASGKDADKKDGYAVRAIELLQKAIKAGYKDASHMAKDTDLAPLRDRDDFRKLLAELVKNSASK